jgi:signal peptidase I
VRRLAALWPLFGLVAVLLAIGCGTSSVNAGSRAEASIGASSALRFGPQRFYRVPSGSMEPTLPVGTRVVVQKRPLTVGAIVAYHPPQSFEIEECGPKPHMVEPGGAACDTPVAKESKIKVIKRIVAGPGDEIYVREGHVYRKASGTREFVRESDPYIRACGGAAECNFPVPIKIAAGQWFLMGDNRGESDDSRFWGPVPTAWIIGTATELQCRRFGERLTWVRRTWREGCGVAHDMPRVSGRALR